MKLRNKKTGEIPDKIETIAYIQWSAKIMMVYINTAGERIMNHYDSLKEFNEEWEDYEEPKDYFYIASDGKVHICEDNNDGFDKGCESIGNRFATREEAEQAVEKLKAWKRLKDAGVMFKGWGWEKHLGNYVVLGTKDADCLPDEIELNEVKDLNLLFGGKE